MNNKNLKKVLFVCVENACRSQMAEAIFSRLVSGRSNAVSAGTKPAERINPNAVKVMEEIGIDISAQRPKLLTSKMVKEADIIITMGCGADACPVVPKVVDDWKIEDPSGKSIEKFREVRDKIKKRVENLIKNISS